MDEEDVLGFGENIYLYIYIYVCIRRKTSGLSHDSLRGERPGGRGKKTDTARNLE